MKVLIVASYNLGYFAAFIREQAAALEKQGCEVRIFGIQGKGIKGYLHELPRLRKEIKEYQPNIIHAHYGLSCLFSNIATRRIPVISTFHGTDIHLPQLRRLSRIAMRLSAWNIFVSENTMNQIPMRLRKNSSFVPCGIDLSDEQLVSRTEARKALGWGMTEKKVLFAGRFDDWMKNVELAKSTISNLQSPIDLIELKGYTRSEVNRLMCAVNCLLMTSHAEASPQVIKEALACGCPIVSVDVGDVAERMNGIDGCYVVSSREPKDIADALKKALAFNGRTSGRERIIADGLTNELVAEKIIGIYKQVKR